MVGGLVVRVLVSFWILVFSWLVGIIWLIKFYLRVCVVLIGLLVSSIFMVCLCCRLWLIVMFGVE